VDAGENELHESPREVDDQAPREVAPRLLGRQGDGRFAGESPASKGIRRGMLVIDAPGYHHDLRSDGPSSKIPLNFDEFIMNGPLSIIGRFNGSRIAAVVFSAHRRK
jgi:hypothetical protein